MKRRDVFDLFLLAALWGASFLFTRIAAPEVGPVPLIALRVAIAALFLLPFVLARGHWTQVRLQARPLLALGLMNSALPFCLYAWAALSLTAGFASVINASTPLFAALVAWLWLGDRLTTARVVGLGVGFLGVLMLVWDGIGLKSDGSGLAALVALGAPVLYGISASYTRRRLMAVPAVVTAFGSQLGAAIVLAPAAAVFWPATPFSGRAWLAVAALGVACTGLAYLLYFRLIARIGAARAVAVTFLIPVFGLGWGALILDEPLTLGMLLAGGVVLLGTALATGRLTLARRRPEPADATCR